MSALKALNAYNPLVLVLRMADAVYVVQPNSWVEVRQCSTDNEWCCNPDGDCCSDGTPRFALENHLPSPSTSSSSSAAVTSYSSSPSVSTSAASSTSGSAASEQTDHADTGSHKSIVGPAVGGALGGAAVLALIGAVVMYMLRRRQNHESDNMSSMPPHPETSTAPKADGGYYAPINPHSDQFSHPQHLTHPQQEQSRMSEAGSIPVRPPAEMQA